ncbi:MAG: DUF5916 domain-containing protein [Gemmatimonadales bacterium]|nr:DUF5916 domain-containing protein [Gemmatimonadales bacterium]
MKTLWLVLVTIAALPRVAPAQLVDGELRVPRLSRRPAIDGVLEDEVWSKAAVLDRWVQINPGDNATPYGRTVAYLGYDDQAFYLAIRAADQPGRIRYRLHERDAIVSQAQDYIGINIDPTNARRRAFTIAVNPIGVEGDGVNVEGTGFEEWDGIFDVAGKVRADEYVIELAIPFKSIRYPPRAEQRWGLSLARFYGRDGAKDSPWPIDRDLGCDLCHMITLVGMRDLGSTTAFELNPSVVGRTSQSRPELGGALDPARRRGEFGANLKYGITPEVTLDGTWNPDFSQVEADAGQLEVNNRFALFFPERRPFFLEGADIFLTRFGMPGQDPSFFTPPVNVFYSRRIADPDAGVKLTGKVGRVTGGFLGALDAARDYDLDLSLAGRSAASFDPFLDQEVKAGVARVKVDVAADGFVGATITGRRFGDGTGLTASLDGRLRFRNTTFRFLATRSRTTEPDVLGRIRRTLAAGVADPQVLAATLDSLPDEVRALDHESRRGTALQASVEYDDRHWNAGLGVVDITPDFETPLGFTQRTDFALLSGYVAYTWQSTGFFRQIHPQVRFEEGYDHSASGRIGAFDQRTDRLLSGFIDFRFPRATDVSVGYTRAFLRIDDVPFAGLDRFFVYVASQALAGVGVDLFIRGGEEAIFDDAVEGGPASPSFFFTGSLSTTVRPAPSLRVGFELNAARVWRRTPAATRDGRYGESAIPRIRTQWQLSRRIGVRLIGEYRFERFFDRAGDLAVKRDVLRTDALLTYLVHPGQSVQAGWSNLAESDLVTPLRMVARGGAAKLSYLWRF